MDLRFDDTQVAFAGKSNVDLRRAQLLFASFGSPWIVQHGSTATATLLRMGMPGVALAIKATIYSQFCGGESIGGCQHAVDYLARGGVKAILDYSVEGEKSEAGFDATAFETIATLDYAQQHPVVAFGVFKVTGLARHALLHKLAEHEALSAHETAEWDRVRQRVERVCQRAADAGVCILIDAEETWIQGPVDELADAMMARFNRDRALVYATFQMYRRDRLGHLQAAVKAGRAAGYHVGAKIVRGAYLEKERKRASEKGYPDPMQPDKAATDAAYDQALRFSVENLDRVGICAGTHNESSCLFLVGEMERLKIDRADPRIFFSQLFGMSDNISFNLARAGYNVAKYLPYGPLKSVLPYLVRRAQENTAIAGQGSRELRLIETELKRRASAS